MKNKFEIPYFIYLRKVFRQLLFLFVLLVLQENIFAETSYSGNISQETEQAQKSLTGIVVDKSEQPLPGVTVLVKGTTMGTVTDVDGKFRIEVPSTAEYLQFSFVGMKTQEVAISRSTEIRIVMVDAAIGLDEVVAIGYGTQSREKVTTSVSKMDSRVLENAVFSNAASALQGTLSGVRVQSTSGQPGASPTVIVRGGTSIDDPDGATPLYVIDGVMREDMDNISTDDIESIQVLKDAASTSIYGARGSNGVVVVTTKSGKSGDVKVTFSSNFSVAEPVRKYKLASARDYLTMSRSGITNYFTDTYTSYLTAANGFGTGNDLTTETAYTTQYLTDDNKYKLNEGWESMTDPVDDSKTLIFKDTDWQEVLFRKALSQEHNISVSGGGDKSRFSLSAGYLNNKGTAIYTDLDRYNIGLNGDIDVNEKLNVFGNVNYATSVDHQINDVRYMFARAAWMPPTMKYKFEDGTLAPGESQTQGNPEYYLSSRDVERTKDNLTLTVGADWKITKDLDFKPSVSIYNTMSDSTSFQPAYYNGVSTYVDSRTSIEQVDQWRQVQVDGVLSYKKTFASDHDVDAQAGYSYYKRKVRYFYAEGEGAETDLVSTLNAASTPIDVSSSVSELIMVGLFGRVNYNYKNRYLMSVNMRYDGASNLGEDHKYGFFPGVSLGWNMHQESFWQNMPLDLRVKLRASYGVNGNIGNLGDYAAQGTYEVGSLYDGYGGIQSSVMANSDLQWERSKTLNFGTDVSILKNRVKMMVDVYRRITDNLITDYELAPSSGYSSVPTNLGSLKNTGLDFEINADVLSEASKFKWNTGFNFSYVKTRIKSLPYNGVENNRVDGTYVWDSKKGDYAWKGGLQEGGRIGDYYIWRNMGVYATDEDAADAPIDEKSSTGVKLGGDIIWEDLDGDGSISTYDQVYAGNPYPTITGGFNNYFLYKNFGLSVRMDYTCGHTVYNYIKAFGQLIWKTNMNMDQEMVDHSWKEQGDETYLNRYYFEGTTQQKNRASQLYYENGDYLALRELTLSYQLPESLLFANISAIRFHLTGTNLYYFTKYDGLNPEFGGQDYGRYPMPRTITFGFNVTF